jgi:hypothetical protein
LAEKLNVFSTLSTMIEVRHGALRGIKFPLALQQLAVFVTP